MHYLSTFNKTLSYFGEPPVTRYWAMKSCILKSLGWVRVCKIWHSVFMHNLKSSKIKWFHEGQKNSWGLVLYLHLHLEHKWCWRVCLLSSLWSCQPWAPVGPSSSWLIWPWRKKLFKASCTFNAQSGITSVPALGLLTKGGEAGIFLLVDFLLRVVIKILGSHWLKEQDYYRKGKHRKGHFCFWDVCLHNLIFLLKGQRLWLRWRERKLVGMIWEKIRFNKLWNIIL